METEFAYLWKSPFGWAVIAGTQEHGASRFDFGYSTKNDCLKKAAMTKNMTLSQALETELMRQITPPQKGPAWMKPAINKLNGYFSGKNVRFDIPLDWSDFSEFQKSVWRATAKIPYGQTKTYSWVARAAGSPAATRAAGSALGVNPLPVIIPCHRVVRADGALGGFGMGLPMKEKLLKLESK